MDMREPEVHSFIIKIWLEESGDETEIAFWRGHITHVPSRERKPLRRLSDITNFIEPYLENLDDASIRGSSLRRLARRLSLGRTKRFH